MSFTIKNGDFPPFFVWLPEGKITISLGELFTNAISSTWASALNKNPPLSIGEWEIPWALGHCVSHDISTWKIPHDMGNIPWHLYLLNGKSHCVSHTIHSNPYAHFEGSFRKPAFFFQQSIAEDFIHIRTLDGKLIFTVSSEDDLLDFPLKILVVAGGWSYREWEWNGWNGMMVIQSVFGKTIGKWCFYGKIIGKP